MSSELQGLRVAFVVANDGIEQGDLTRPWEAVVQAGGRPELIAPEAGRAQARNHLEKAELFPVDRTTGDVEVADSDALVLPGGVGNPDRLRMDRDAVEFARAMVEAGKPVAAICHGPWTLAEADVVRGRTMTSWPSLQTDLRNAGATWVDRDVITCTDGPNVLVTSRKPDDLGAFCGGLRRALASTSRRSSAA